ncbi:hypothetical protein C8R46DRAFT_1037930 [Mycena filopes]|nr:hypothetical protein C8R46DRAFT_1037930 [Mycena filopes]
MSRTGSAASCIGWGMRGVIDEEWQFETGVVESCSAEFSHSIRGASAQSWTHYETPLVPSTPTSKGANSPPDRPFLIIIGPQRIKKKVPKPQCPRINPDSKKEVPPGRYTDGLGWMRGNSNQCAPGTQQLFGARHSSNLSGLRCAITLVTIERHMCAVQAPPPPPYRTSNLLRYFGPSPELGSSDFVGRDLACKKMQLRNECFARCAARIPCNSRLERSAISFVRRTDRGAPIAARFLPPRAGVKLNPVRTSLDLYNTSPINSRLNGDPTPIPSPHFTLDRSTSKISSLWPRIPPSFGTRSPNSASSRAQFLATNITPTRELAQDQVEVRVGSIALGPVDPGLPLRKPLLVQLGSSH